MFILIVNPLAGKGKADRIFKAIQKDPVFKEKNCRSFRTNYEGHAEKLAEQIAEIHHEHLKCLIVIGGDGTLHEVINGLHQYPSIPVSIIPTGSGNDFTRALGIKGKGVSLFKKVVQNPKRRTVNVGRYVINKRHKHSQHLFLNHISLGLDSEIVHFANRPFYRKWMKRLRLHRLTYSLALLPVLKNFQPINLEIELDGLVKPLERATLVAVSNHPYYGGGMKIAPDAELKDEQFTVTVIDDIPKWKVIALFLTVFIGKHTMLKEVSVYKASTVKVSSKRVVPFQVDGQSGECFQCDLVRGKHTRTIFLG
ncbi:diacylglycerol/lipid kinase family protein [Halobacillus salinus]|uniref:diacylglycerol kinase (ATP) n=1 Tax=Halobacillus salinus TaxID=192814 RepID=A0A4Z0GUA4_9BACI|nr:diacylglycerol kinase family protein [Halobacillus salinus]TGB00694.1 diacylglycerol kinase family lipid kinase [Halobacillus salinus]